MKFTDRDLRRWIKNLSKDSCWACCFDKKNKFKALLARLEAVEKVLMTVCHCPNDEHTAECPENIAYIAWCESAGKDE